MDISIFADLDASSWEVKYVEKANNMCVIDGYKVDGELIFRPYQNMTRAEVSKVVANAIGVERDE